MLPHGLQASSSWLSVSAKHLNGYVSSGTCSCFCIILHITVHRSRRLTYVYTLAMCLRASWWGWFNVKLGRSLGVKQEEHEFWPGRKEIVEKEAEIRVDQRSNDSSRFMRTTRVAFERLIFADKLNPLYFTYGYHSGRINFRWTNIDN